MIGFTCPVCHRSFAYEDVIICVTPGRRKHRRGRIAWNRDGICAECAKREEQEHDYQKDSGDLQKPEKRGAV